MKNADTPHRWLQAFRSQPRAVPLDPADMGTAFGLDASFDEAHGIVKSPPMPAKPGWVQRLSSRRWRPA